MGCDGQRGWGQWADWVLVGGVAGGLDGHSGVTMGKRVGAPGRRGGWGSQVMEGVCISVDKWGC